MNTFIFEKNELSDLLYPDYCDRKTLYDFMIDHRGYVKGKVLDFGCGEKPYQRLFEADEYIGLDTEKSGHGWDDKTGPDYFYDGEHIPFDDETFDTILSTQVFEHVEKIDEVMAELSRVAKVGGCL